MKITATCMQKTTLLKRKRTLTLAQNYCRSYPV